MNLLRSLQAFDGKQTGVLEQISSTLRRDPRTVAELLKAAEHDDARLQVAATWILKRWVDEGEPAVQERTPQLAHALTHAADWQSQLHLLQALALLQIPQPAVPPLTRALAPLITHTNRFLRAWSLSVYARIAEDHEPLREKVLKLLGNAEHDDAAAVRARVRQIRKRIRWA